MANYKGPALVHSVLASVSFFVGFGFPFYFGFYDYCEVVSPETPFDGYNIHRDLCDLYIPLIFVGFIHLGFLTGICQLKSVTNVEQHQGEIYKNISKIFNEK